MLQELLSVLSKYEVHNILIILLNKLLYKIFVDNISKTFQINEDFLLFNCVINPSLTATVENFLYQ